MSVVLAGLVFRRATLADVPLIVAMLADDDLGKTREDTSVPLAPAYVTAFETIDRNPEQLLAVAELDGEVVGTLQITFLPGLSHKGAWRGQIEAVRVASPRRSHGIGARMIDWAIAQCRRRGCHVVQLTTNLQRVDAHRFYERLGFKHSHAGYKLAL